jgi:hypothetical protein
MAGWSFLTNHGRVLLCIAHDPGVRLRDIAASVGITERSAYAIVTDLAAAGYAVKQKDGRRNRYQIQADMPLPEPTSQQLAIGEVLALLAGATAGRQLTRGNRPEVTTASRTAEACEPRSLEPETRPGANLGGPSRPRRRQPPPAPSSAVADGADLTVFGSAVTPPDQGLPGTAPGRAVFWILAGRCRLCLTTSC